MNIISGTVFILCIFGWICSGSMYMEGGTIFEGRGQEMCQNLASNPNEECYPAHNGNNNVFPMTEEEIDALVAESAKDYTDMDAWKKKESLDSSFPFPMSIEEIDTLVAERAKDHIEMDVWQEKENLAFSLQSPSTSYCPQSHAEYSYAPSSLWPECSNQAVSSSNQSRKVKRSHRSVGEGIVKSKKRKKESDAAISTDTSSEWGESGEKLDEKKNRIEYNLSIWNNTRLKEKHRKSMKYGYIPVYNSNYITNRRYNAVGDEDHIRLIQEHARHCMDVFRTVPTRNRMQFIICSRTTAMHIKLADCEAIAKHPELFQWIKECDDYYPGMPEDMAESIKEHGPKYIDKNESEMEQKKIENKKETIGDVCAREPIDSPCAIDKESIVVKSNKLGILVIETAVRMVMGLSEVWKDFHYLKENFIEDTLREETGSEYATVIRALYTIAKNPTADVYSPEVNSAYQTLTNYFDPITMRTDLSPVQKVMQIYIKLYRSLVWFYERASMFREKLDTEKRKDKRKNRKEYTPVEGKHIIRDQVYLKWSARIETDRELSENTHHAEEEINRWIIHPYVQAHYHVHYVDNTTQQYRRLCMPVGPDGRGIHTIHQIVKYIERVHGIEEYGQVHLYARDRATRCWSYLEEKSRNRIVQEFMLYYDIVFYYIKEGLRNNYFTFAEFESFKRPSGEVVRIPLFLSPLMRSIGESGPFEKKQGAEHTLVEDMQFSNRRPDIYVYGDKYRAYLYYPVHHYYSNLYIRVTNADIHTVDCYIMDTQMNRDQDSIVVTWYVKAPQSVDEYTHCMMSDEFWTRPEAYSTFIRAVYCREYTPDSRLYGFGIRTDAEKDSRISSSQNTFAGMEKIVIDPLNIEDRNRDEDAIESKLGDLDAELEGIKRKEKEKGLSTEEKKELKRRRHCISTLKYKQKKKKKDMQKEVIKEKKPILPSFTSNRHSFIVLRWSNTETKSSLGLWNELFDMFISGYSW